jgi:hypothetical protein
MSTIRRKIPGLLVEALSVVFAVLVALGVDEWREDKANLELAGRALAGLTAEIENNLVELDSTRDENVSMLAQLDAALAEGGPQSFSMEFEYTQLSQAAWQTSQVTQAVHFVDYEAVQRIARLYDLQELFIENQRALVDLIGGVMGGTDPADVIYMLRGRLAVVMELEAGLAEAYREVLAELSVS